MIIHDRKLRHDESAHRLVYAITYCHCNEDEDCECDGDALDSAELWCEERSAFAVSIVQLYKEPTTEWQLSRVALGDPGAAVYPCFDTCVDDTVREEIMADALRFFMGKALGGAW